MSRSLKPKSDFLKAFGVAFEIFKAIADAVISLGGQDDDLREIIRNSELTKAIAKLIMEARQKVVAVWKKIKLGTGLKTAENFRDALKQNGIKIGDWASDILGKPAFKVSDTEQEVKLVIKSVAELGFAQGATYTDIKAKAKEIGLDLCPAEVGPQLRLQYLDQPKGEWLIIAMEPIAASDGNLRLFNVVAHGDDGLWLHSNYGNPDDFWHADPRFVFCRK